MARLQLPGAWQQCAFAFLTSIYDISGSDQSLYGYHGYLALFFASGLHPDEVTKTDIETFINRASVGRGREGQPVAASTRNHRLCVLNSFYRFASTYHVDGKPLYTKAIPSLGISYAQPDIVYKALNDQELERFFAAIPDRPVGWRDRALFLTYFWTARRRSEIYQLRWGEIESASFQVDKTTRRAGYVYRYEGKGHSRQTKAKELPQPAYDAIVWYLEKTGRLKTIQPDDPVFAAVKLTGKGYNRTDPGLNGDYINLRFKWYCQAAGLDPKFTLHSLRHTSAHERDQAGQELYSISETLDHSDPGTTFHYLRRMSGTADTGASLLEKRFRALGAMD